jgi:hypothetical protein
MQLINFSLAFQRYFAEDANPLILKPYQLNTKNVEQGNIQLKQTCSRVKYYCFSKGLIIEPFVSKVIYVNSSSSTLLVGRFNLYMLPLLIRNL